MVFINTPTVLSSKGIGLTINNKVKGWKNGLMLLNILEIMSRDKNMVMIDSKLI